LNNLIIHDILALIINLTKYFVEVGIL